MQKRQRQFGGGSGDDFMKDDGGAIFNDQDICLGDGNDEIVPGGRGETFIYGGTGPLYSIPQHGLLAGNPMAA